MEPSKQDLQQTQQSRPEEKKRHFRLVKLEEQRFRIDKLEDRIAPKPGHSGVLTSSSAPLTSK